MTIYCEWFYDKEKKGVTRIARYLYEKQTGEPIPQGYVISHKNGDVCDNSPNNLQCVPAGHQAIDGAKIRWIRTRLNRVRQVDILAFCEETLARETADYEWHRNGRRLPYPSAE